MPMFHFVSCNFVSHLQWTPWVLLDSPVSCSAHHCIYQLQAGTTWWSQGTSGNHTHATRKCRGIHTSQWKWVLVVQSCPTVCDPTDYKPTGSSVHEILHTRILEWVAIPFSRGSSWRSNPGLPQCRWTLYYLSHQGSPVYTSWNKPLTSRKWELVDEFFPLSLPGQTILKHCSWVFSSCHNKCLRLGDLNSRNVSFPSSGGWKSKFKVPSEASLLHLHRTVFLLCPHLVIPPSVCALMLSS